MRDVARELGISVVTVSKALAGKEGVGEQLRQKIVRKAAELGYVYNNLPRNLLYGRNYNIGVLVSSRYLGFSSFYWRFLKQLLVALKKTAYSALLEIVEADEEAGAVIPSFIRDNKADGVIVLGQFSDTYLSFIAEQTKKRVFLDFYSEIGSTDCIATNNFLGSYNLTKLLIEAGHEKIGFIGSPKATTSILDRYVGFCKAMLEAALPYDAAIEDRDARGVYLDQMDIRPEHYTAYVCNNDQLAGAVISNLRGRGCRVPEDISLAGFDNDNETVTAGVGVTSFEVNIQAMCDAALRALIGHIESDDYKPQGVLLIDGRIVEKASIARQKRNKT
ncbi:MAG: LacI family DNA-binding transcriptional regulator [Spirochaetaceae bacterium]|jgi:LacI family transcriptional regulator|nr:LacI family DNA-binding transcriptional regulator [Spirochaetaceae bacterium]